MKLDATGDFRVHGRVQGKHVAFHSNQLIRRIVRHVHCSIGHLGREYVIEKLQENAWIPQVCVFVRSVINGCLKCKKFNARPMTQQMAPLPKSRLMACERPFSYTGMGLYDPLYVKDGRGSGVGVTSRGSQLDGY